MESVEAELRLKKEELAEKVSALERKAKDAEGLTDALNGKESEVARLIGNVARLEGALVEKASALEGKVEEEERGEGINLI